MTCANYPRFASLVCLSILSFTARDAVAASIPDLPRSEHKIVIDGKLSDAAWADALRISLDLQTQPGENTAAPVETTALLIENGSSLYVAFDARDPEPEKIRAYLRDRDSAFQDDFVGIVLDTFNDQRRAYEFFVNPLGVQMDLTQDEITGEEDDSWDAIWDSAGVVTDQGYVVELEIPFSQLRFPHSDDALTFGVDLIRMYPREHRYRIGSNALDRNVNCYLCQVSKLSGLRDVKHGKGLEIVPTLTAAQTSSRDDPATDPLLTGDVDVDPGLSLRWGITPEITANLAINPDFSQVEADVAQLDVNNQFALFFPEKRPFFLDGADYFRTPVNAVFTRTVADPDYGLKLTGKRNNNTFGVFATEDRLTNLLLPGPFGSDSESLEINNRAVVGRYSRSFGEASTLGALFTSRQADSYDNSVGAVDGRWKINDQHSIRGQLLRSSTEYPAEIVSEYEQPDGRFAGNAYAASYNYNSRNWFAYVRSSELDRNFRADAGFVSRVDYEQQVIGLGLAWHGEEDSWWKRLQVNADWDITHDNDGRLLEREWEGYMSIRGPMQWFMEFGGLTRDVLFDDVLFHENKVSLYTEIKPRGGLFLGLWARVGDQIDFANTRLGDQVRLEPRVEWNVNEHLLFRLRSALVSLDSKNGEKIFDAQVHDLRLTWQFSVRSFLRLTIQHRDVERNQDLYIEDVQARERRVGRQLLYSYKINPQTVFFLGYSDGLEDDDDLQRLTTAERTVFLKIGYAWLP